MKKLLCLLALHTIINQGLQAQPNMAPFVAYLQMNGNPDQTFNNNAYSLFALLRADKTILARSFFTDDQKNSYFAGTLGTLGNPASGVQKPVVFKLEGNRISPTYNAGPTSTYTDFNPRTQYFVDFETYAAVMHPDKGVVTLGAAKRAEGFFPYLMKLNSAGFLDNFYREGGSHLVFSQLNNRIKAGDVGKNYQAFAVESYTPNQVHEKLMISNLNGNNIIISTDSLKNVESPVIKATDNFIFLAGQTKVGNILTDFYKDGGLTIAKYDITGKFVPGFGNGGKVEIPVTSGKFIPQSITVMNDLIYVAGKVGTDGIGIIRLKADGSLDESFGGDGISVKYLVGNNISYGDMVVSTSGIYITGSYGKTFFIYKVNADGSFDLSWNVGNALEFNSLHNFAGVAYSTDKIVSITPFKLSIIGTGADQRLVIAGNAVINK